jgi:autotransporter passenger strand-loop-strand repeat protein
VLVFVSFLAARYLRMPACLQFYSQVFSGKASGMPKNTSKFLNITGSHSLHSHGNPQAQRSALPGSQSRFLTPASLLLAFLCLGAQQAQAAETTVEKGQTVKDAVIDKGDRQLVYGKVANTTVRNQAGGSLSVQKIFGTAEDTTLERAGYQGVETGGVAKNTIVLGDGAIRVESGGTIENLTVESGGTAILVSGSIWKGVINFKPGSVDSFDPTLTTTWKMTGNSAFNSLYLDSTGHIDFEAPGSVFAAKTLSIYVLNGNGGLITLNQVLGDGSEPGDKIIIRDKGRVTGTTYLAIRNYGGLGGQTTGDGMLVVEAQGSATTTAQGSQDGFKLKQPPPGQRLLACADGPLRPYGPACAAAWPAKRRQQHGYQHRPQC